jgi:chromosome segregation ATPase
MCHPKLTIKLCQNVNFIYGQNGSGKSAILAALQICLGVGAKRTNRARNLKELVRKEDGATHAIVRVTLLNKGPDAFQHEIYGDTVTIERFISLHGSGGGYKLYGHDDPNHKKPKSTKKEDLNQLLDQLNIQVENPVAVLDQEEAKKFLTGRPEDKYAFFTKATDLERMDRKYGETVDNINELIDALEKMEKAIDPLERNVHVLQKEYEDFKKLEHLEVRAEEANVKWAWSFYTAVLAELEAESKVRKDQVAKFIFAASLWLTCIILTRVFFFRSWESTRPEFRGTKTISPRKKDKVMMLLHKLHMKKNLESSRRKPLKRVNISPLYTGSSRLPYRPRNSRSIP